MKAIHCVYQIFNTKNSRSYIGSTVNFSQRKRRHFNDLKKGCHSSVFMQRDYAKCGVEAFEIRVIEQVESPSNLIAREQFWIDSVKPEYNSAKIAGSTLGIKHSIEVVLKNKERNTGFGNGNARITQQHANQIVGMLNDFTQVEIAEKFGVSRTTVQRLCRRIGSTKSDRLFNSKAREVFSEKAKRTIAGRNALPVHMFRASDRSTMLKPSITEAAAVLGIDVSAVAKRLKRKSISHCNGYFISHEPIDAAMVAWPFRRSQGGSHA